MDWDLFLSYVILVLYIGGIMAIAAYYRNKAKTLDQFYLAGRGLGPWMTAFSYGATYFSAVIFIGYAGNLGWRFGTAAIWIGIGNGLIGALLAWKVLAKRTRNITRRLDVKTMPSYFEKRYDGKYLKLIACLIIFVFLIPYSASVYNGLGYMFSKTFKMNYTVCVLILAAITALYVFFGGYLASALSDFVQGIIMLVGIAIMVVFVLASKEVSWFSGFKELSDRTLGIIPSGSLSNKFYDNNFFTLLMLVCLTSFGVWALPQIIHRYYVIKHESTIKRGMVISTVFSLIIGGGAYLVGSFGRLFFDAKPSNIDTIVPDLLAKSAMPGVFMGFIAVLLFAASMGTLAALALSSASTVSMDLYKGYIKKDASEKQVKILLRVLSLVFIFLSAILAIGQVDTIVTLMGLSWGTVAGCFIGPFVLGLFFKHITKAAAYCSLIGGVVFTFAMTIIIGGDALGWSGGLWQIIKKGVTYSPMIGVFTMVFSIIITLVVSLFTKRPGDDVLHEAFSKEVPE